ncbi:hypothetical protein ACFVYA_45660 [Amycolatopsis sp. NPDC058278]|uniref:hypothetical protein n=1 Tax=Amycolatopsis sp. NPDC058278 TaxID=3346417 RepID=UPI0036DBA896
MSSQLNLLSTLLTDAAGERLIPFNAVRRRRRCGRRSRRAVAERIWATPEQVVRLSEQAGVLGGPIARLLVITAAWTGCRWGELAGLRRDNVDLGRGVIVIDPLVGALHESGSMLWLGPPKTRASHGRSRSRRSWSRCCETISPGTGTGTSSCSRRRAGRGCGARRSFVASSAQRSTVARRPEPRRGARRSGPG